MAFHRLLSVVATIVVLLVTVHPRRAASARLPLFHSLPSLTAAARDRFSASTGGQSAAVPVAGLCSSPLFMQTGYKCQEYHVTTADGFIISISRLPEGKNGGGAASGPSGKQPVLLQHGILMDGLSWMINAPNQSLPFMLVDNGYDVWISNTRGTRYSRRHISHDPSSNEFWDWTWDDLVTNELTATTDYVFNQTGQKLHYIGHSLGTLVPLAGFSEGKQIDKLKSAALLSPIAYLSQMTTALGQLCAKAFIGEIEDLFGLAEFNPVGPQVARFLKVLCAYPRVDCYHMITEMTGPNCCLDTTTFNSFLKNEPQSTSTKNLVHLAQSVRFGGLTKYNYRNEKANMDHYGSATPPVYNLANIPKDFPLLLSYGGQDKLSDVRDVQILLDKLKSHDVDKLTVQFVKEYAHMDFIMAVNADDVVFKPLMAFMRSHQ